MDYATYRTIHSASSLSFLSVCVRFGDPGKNESTKKNETDSSSIKLRGEGRATNVIRENFWENENRKEASEEEPRQSQTSFW